MDTAFSIVICLVDFHGKFVASGFVAGLDNGGGKRRSLCKKTLKSQDREIPLQHKAIREFQKYTVVMAVDATQNVMTIA